MGGGSWVSSGGGAWLDAEPAAEGTDAAWRAAAFNDRVMMKGFGGATWEPFSFLHAMGGTQEKVLLAASKQAAL